MRTTVPDTAAPCPRDYVNRQVKADRPQSVVGVRLHVRVHLAKLYVAFIIDVVARRVVGWRVRTTMPTDFVLAALEQALYDRHPRQPHGLVDHGDPGSQYVSIRYMSGR